MCEKQCFCEALTLPQSKDGKLYKDNLDFKNGVLQIRLLLGHLQIYEGIYFSLGGSDIYMVTIRDGIIVLGCLLIS
uniref:Uncharacterized protein n=1 Tax=Arundo donax TaxID=35708 RepID=A0A0A8YI26_ARUDO